MEIKIDGREVFVSDSGDPLARPVLLIHGAGGCHQAWKAQIPALSGAGLRCLAVDLPGHGQSRGPAMPRVGLLAEWLVALMDALKLQQVALAGHSLGSQVALETAAKAPDRVRAVALLATADVMPVNEKLLALAKSDSSAAIDQIKSWAVARELDEDAWSGLLDDGGSLFADLSAAGSYGDAPAAAARTRHWWKFEECWPSRTRTLCPRSSAILAPATAAP